MKYLFISILAFTYGFSNAQKIRTDELKKNITYLSSDELQGRGTSTDAEKKACEYIMMQFRMAHLVPKGTQGYLSEFTFKKNPGIAAEKEAALYIESNGLTVRNSIFENNNIAILAENYSALTITGNTFIGNQAPMKISSFLANISDNTAQNNNINGILLQGFGFTDALNQVTWPKNALPYVIENNLAIPLGKTLEIESGVIVKFKGAGAMNAAGSLIADGKTNDKIIFTSINDDEYGGDTNNDGEAFQPAAGQWKFIKFSGPSANSDLNNIVVRYGGFMGTRGGVNDRDGALKVENHTLLIKNSVIENNRVGIQMINSDFDGKSKNISVGNNAIGVYIEGDCPDLSEIIFEQNTEYDIFPTDCQN